MNNIALVKSILLGLLSAVVSFFVIHYLFIAGESIEYTGSVVIQPLFFTILSSFVFYRRLVKLKPILIFAFFWTLLLVLLQIGILILMFFSFFD